MRVHLYIRSRAVLAIAAASVPLLGGRFALGQTYSTTATPIYTPGSLKIGANSASNITDLLELDNGVIAGSLGSGPLYDLPTQSPYNPSFVSTDSNHTGNPSLVGVSSAGVLVGTQNRISGSTALGTDVFTYNGSGSQFYLPLPTTVLGGGAAYYYTNQSVNMASYTMNATQPTDSALTPAAYAVGSTGVVAGTVQRYSGDANNANVSRNTIVGADAFYYNPSTQQTTAIGLTGGAYNYYNSGTGTLFQNSVVTGVAGTSVAVYVYTYPIP